MRLKRKLDMAEIVFDVIKYLVLFVFFVLCFYPFYYVFIYSISDPYEAQRGVWLWPKGFSFAPYKQILKNSNLGAAFCVSLARTVLGTATTIICTSVLAFLVTRKEMFARKFVYRYCIVSMYLGAGIIPWYLLMKAYGFQNNFLLYIIPGAVNTYYMILIKTFIEQLPESLEESATIEGAGFFDILFKIILPLSKPIIATVAVYTAVGQWNSWQDNFFLVHDSKLKTLQLALQEHLKSAGRLEAMLLKGGVDDGLRESIVTGESAQMAAIVLTVAPILLVYPFAQRYFTKGIMMGAIKG